MLKITATQFRKLSAPAEADFAKRVANRLRQFFPALRRLNEEDILEFAKRGIERAHSYGIVSAQDISKYVGLMAFWGEDFDTAEPWATAILTSTVMDPVTKVACLYVHSTFETRSGPS
jgi:hypothetical protein